MAGPEPSEILKFEAAFLRELEKRGFLLIRYTPNGFVVAGGKPPSTEYSVDSRNFYEMYVKEGKQIEQLAEILASTGQQIEGQSPTGKADPSKLIAIVRDDVYMRNSMEKIRGIKKTENIAPDDPDLPLAYEWRRGHNYYILAGIDLGDTYAFVPQRRFGDYGLDDRQMLKLLLENAYKRTVEVIKNGDLRAVKISEGAVSIRMVEDLAPSFLIISYAFFDMIMEMAGFKDTDFIFAYPVTTDEIVFIHPKATKESMKIALDYRIETQSAGRRSKSVSLEPLIISRREIDFLNDSLDIANRARQILQDAYKKGEGNGLWDREFVDGLVAELEKRGFIPVEPLELGFLAANLQKKESVAVHLPDLYRAKKDGKSMAEISEAFFSKKPLRKEDIYPIVQDRSKIALLLENIARAKGIGMKEMDKTLPELPLLQNNAFPELMTAFVWDVGPSMAYVTVGDIRALDLRPEDIPSLAWNNLRRMLDSMIAQGKIGVKELEKGVFSLTIEKHLAGSFLLFSNEYAGFIKERTGIGGPVYAIPASSMELIIFGADTSPERFAEIMKAVGELRSKAEYSLSMPEPMVITPGKVCTLREWKEK